MPFNFTDWRATSTLVVIFASLFALVPGMLLADEGLRSGEGTKGNDSKSSAEELVKNFLQIHESSSDKDAAPRRYMTFLNTYKRVYNEKKDGVV